MFDATSKEPTLQRARGQAELSFTSCGIGRLYQKGCAKILLPRSYKTGGQDAVLVNTSGGVTGGDKLVYGFEATANASLTVTTQAAERIYRSTEAKAQISTRLQAGERASLEWLPQETILFDHAALSRDLHADLAVSARFLALETLILGRKASGEVLSRADVTDRWRVRRGGQLIYADNFRLLGYLNQHLKSQSTLGGQQALATVLYVAPDAEARLDQARSLLPLDSVEAAASAWNGMLAMRFLASHGQQLRTALIKFLAEFRGADLPRVWHM